MKFSTVLASLAAVAVAGTTASSLHRDTHESGLTTLGARSHEVKARHLQNQSSEDELLGRAAEKRDFVSKWGKLTWYAGNQLDAPACGGPRPNDGDHIVAVKKGGGYGDCGDTLHIHWKGKMVSAKVVDYCAGCEWGHIDATKGVFSALDNLEQGVLDGIHFKLITKKKGKKRH